MAITQAAFTTVAPRQAIPQARVHPLPRDVDDFLQAHVDDLDAKAVNDAAPPATFVDVAARRRFEELGEAPDAAAFAQLASAAAAAIQSEMDNRMKGGLFVALQMDGGGPTLALLKLDARHVSAQIDASAVGVPLKIVRELVDEPGDLQLGAAFPDPRRASDVIIAKGVSGPASAYFARGLGLRQMEFPRRAATRIVQAVAKQTPAKAVEIADLLANTNATTATDFIEQVPESTLNPIEKQQLRRRLESGAWPVQRIEPKRISIRQTLTADGISVSGSVEDMRTKVKVVHDAATDLWRIEITVGNKPEASYSG